MAKRPGVSVTSRFIAVKDQHSTLYTLKKYFASVFYEIIFKVITALLFYNTYVFLSRFLVYKILVKIATDNNNNIYVLRTVFSKLFIVTITKRDISSIEMSLSSYYYRTNTTAIHPKSTSGIL